MLVYGTPRRCPDCGDEKIVYNDVLVYRCQCGREIDVIEEFNEDKTWLHVQGTRRELLGT